MSNKGKSGMQIPMSIPNIGGQQQLPVDLKEATFLKCPCGHDMFDPVFKLGHVSRMAPGNRTGKDVFAPMTTYICRRCGLEFGKQQISTTQ